MPLDEAFPQDQVSRYEPCIHMIGNLAFLVSLNQLIFYSQSHFVRLVIIPVLLFSLFLPTGQIMAKSTEDLLPIGPEF